LLSKLFAATLTDSAASMAIYRVIQKGAFISWLLKPFEILAASRLTGDEGLAQTQAEPVRETAILPSRV